MSGMKFGRIEADMLDSPYSTISSPV